MTNEESTPVHHTWDGFQRGDYNPKWWRKQCEKNRNAIASDGEERGVGNEATCLTPDQSRLMSLIDGLATVTDPGLLPYIYKHLEGVGNGVGVPLPAIEAEILRRRRLFDKTPLIED